MSPGAVAVAWTLHNPGVGGAITGFRRPDQVDAIVAAAGLELSDDDVAEIGSVLGVTESRVCQMHTKAVLELRNKMNSEISEG